MAKKVECGPKNVNLNIYSIYYFYKKVDEIIRIIFIIIILIFLDIMITSYSKAKKSDVIILLGCNLNSFFINQRIEKTIELYKKNIAKHIIVTGKGNGKVSEAIGMRKRLIEYGIPDEYIHVEDEAMNTYENLKFSKRIMILNNFKNATIVSDAYHLARIKLICGNINLEATFEGKECRYYGRYEILAIIREIPAYIKDFIISFIDYKIKKSG